MLQSRTTSTTRPTVAYIGSRAIRLAPLACPYCHHGLRAHDVEPIGDEVRLICPACHRDLLTIDR